MMICDSVVAWCVIILAFAHVNKALVQTLVEGIQDPNHQSVIEADNDIGQRTSIEDLYKGKTTSKQSEKLDKIISLLRNLQLEINELKVTVDKLKTNQTYLERKCPVPTELKNKEEKLSGPEFETKSCGNKTAKQGTFFLVDASFGTWDEHSFCQVFAKKRVPETNYVVTAKFYNVNGYHGINYGFPGLAYNIENNRNFDFVYVRLHRSSACYQTGYVQNNQIQWIGALSGLCPNGPPKGRTWFQLQIYVRDNEAILYIDGIQVVVFKPHFPPIGKGGVIVAAGQNNVLRFKDFNITNISPFPFSFFGCKSYHQISNEYYRLDSEYGSWPDSGFCRAISKKTVHDRNYFISASLFNQRGFSGTPQSGVLGLLFNAQDQYNFDFVYFRPLSLGGCYTTGFVQNTNINWVNSKIGSCPGGPFKGAAWNNVTVYVRENDVTIELDGKHLVSTKAHFPSKSVGGILVGNGLSNIASFKNYKVGSISASEFDVYDCTSNSRNTQRYHILDAKHGEWPEDTFCRALSRKVVPGNYYRISAYMFIQGWRNIEDAHNYVGLMYNAKDASNYDFVFIRPSQSGFCYKTGYVMNGAIQFSGIQHGRCAGGAPDAGVWFKMTISVRDSNAAVQLDGKHLVNLKPHFHVFSRGGVIVANGGKNVLAFRDFVAYAIKPFEFEFSGCGKGTHQSNGSFVLDARYPNWPRNGFCMALALKGLDNIPIKYTVHSKIFNIDSWQGSDWGNVGLLFNAVDKNNFEYVYMRLHDKKRCYQFGSVMNGVIRERQMNTGPCGETTPRQGKWLSIRVKVAPNGQVHLKLDHKNIAQYNSSMPWHGRGGVLVANGFRNVMMFREFGIVEHK